MTYSLHDVTLSTCELARGSAANPELDELTDGAHPVRAFNTLGWENCADPVFDGVVADLFYAAEDGHAKQVADRLIADIGLEPVWLGGVDMFDVVNSLTRLWFLLAFQRKLGRRLAFKMLLGRLIRTHFATTLARIAGGTKRQETLPPHGGPGREGEE
jgi:predicted dinucleotide-binding enzyme